MAAASLEEIAFTLNRSYIIGDDQLGAIYLDPGNKGDSHQSRYI
ncbi:MAG: hypothetical protein AAF703_08780 [Cyanobacteria bacterium P01_D01_bin.105]